MTGLTNGYFFFLTHGFQKLAVKETTFPQSNQTSGAIRLNSLYLGNCVILDGITVATGMLADGRASSDKPCSCM